MLAQYFFWQAPSTQCFCCPVTPLQSWPSAKQQCADLESRHARYHLQRNAHRSFWQNTRDSPYFFPHSVKVSQGLIWGMFRTFLRSDNPGGPGGSWYGAGFFLNTCLSRYTPTQARHSSSPVTLVRVNINRSQTVRARTATAKGKFVWLPSSEQAFYVRKIISSFPSR
jgi:hypothetical protein